MEQGDSIEPGFDIHPSNVKNQEVTWTSSDAHIADVSEGKVRGKTIGTCTITATTANGKSDNIGTGEARNFGSGTITMKVYNADTNELLGGRTVNIR